MKAIIQDNVVFKVDNAGVLCDMTNIRDDTKRVSVTIPDAISGVKVKALGKEFCTGLFETVIISPGIETVYEEAFKGAFIHSVSWPSTCPKIPASCFENSQLKQIVGIGDVTNIGSAAFFGTRIKEFKWPEKCTTIPALCFSESRLQTLSGTENVKKIGNHAFSCSWLENISSIENVEKVGIGAFLKTNIQKLKWTPKCKYIPVDCFFKSEIVSITNLQNVEAIGTRAFFEASKIKELDLSNLTISSIGDNAFAGVDPEKVRLPYYADNSVFISQKAPSC